jgi:hypothetical protein
MRSMAPRRVAVPTHPFVTPNCWLEVAVVPFSQTRLMTYPEAASMGVAEVK